MLRVMRGLQMDTIAIVESEAASATAPTTRPLASVGPGSHRPSASVIFDVLRLQDCPLNWNTCHQQESIS